jgi:16S rRNA (guanine527-N7)-methyltransferase
MKVPGNPHISNPETFQKAFAVSRETVERLETYAALLKRWQKTINLIAPSTLDHIWHRHFADSAQLFSLAGLSTTSPSPLGETVGVRGLSESTEPTAPSPGADQSVESKLGQTGRAGLSPRGEANPAVPAVHFLDLGSGAGFPGLVLAIIASETGGTRHTLVESDTRKAAFLREVARQTGVAVEIVADRIESPRTAASVGEVNCVTARALAPMPRLLPWAAPYFGSDTIGLFLKGREVAAELEVAADKWAFQSELLPSVTDPDGRIVRITGVGLKR